MKFREKFKGVIDTYNENYWNNYWAHTNVVYSARPGWDGTISQILNFDTEEMEAEMKKFFLEASSNEEFYYDDQKVMWALKWVIKNMRYKGDFETRKTPEYWQNAYQTFETRVGDCEDGTILLYKICRYLGVVSWKIRIVASLVKYRDRTAGHAYLCYTTYGRDDIAMAWYVLDWCYHPYASVQNFKNKSIGKIDMYNPVIRPIWFSFNEEYEFAQRAWDIPYKEIMQNRTIQITSKGNINTGEKMSEKYSFLTGIGKSIKNNVVIIGGAALGYLLENITNWLPSEYKWALPVVGSLLTYLGYNKIKFTKANK